MNLQELMSLRGRDLDRAVAKYIMGWVENRTDLWDHGGNSPAWTGPPDVVPRTPHEPWRPSECIADAMDVWMTGDYCELVLSGNHVRASYARDAWAPDLCGSCEGDTSACLAICRAALDCWWQWQDRLHREANP